jgi:hypothetical protein
MKKAIVFLMIAGLAFWAATSVEGSSPHTARGCSSCHQVHHARPEGPRDYGVPLMAWRTGTDALEDGTFELYQPVVYTHITFSTLNATLEQPNGPTKLCLSCHDGTYPHLHEDPEGSGNYPARFTPADGLKHSHPVSFLYDAALVALDPELKPTDSPSGLPGGGTIATRLLDSRGRMQCTSCHDSHVQSIGESNLHWSLSNMYGPDNPDGSRGDFIDSGERLMCTTCHIK